MVTRLAAVVGASAEVAATRSRSAKIAILAELLHSVDPTEVEACVGFLVGTPRQGRVGVGYATVYGIEVPAAAQPSLTVADLDSAIAAISAGVGAGSVTRRRQILVELLARATEPEAEFVRRLLAGDLRQGALAGVMADAVATAAGVSADVVRRALMLSGDLTRMAAIAVTGGESGLRAVGLELFRPILPMLAAPGASVAEAMSAFPCASVEFKLDGLRVQIHRRDDQVHIYSRNLNDITHRLPGIVAAVLTLPVGEVILDGEALWMGEAGPASFQDTMSQIDTDASPEGVVTFLFDVLQVDGRDLLDTPLRERSGELRTIAPHLTVPESSRTTPRRPSASWRPRSRPGTRGSSSRTRPRPTRPAAAARRGARSSRC
jgi:DNA ligase 1